MSKRSKLALLGVILLAFVAVATKPLWSPQVVTSQSEPDQVATNQQTQASNVNATTSKLAQLLEDSFAKGKPVAVVYTYNADC